MATTGKAVRAGVVFPFAAQHDLKMRDGIARHFAADAIKAKVGDMMLPATVKAAAYLNV